MISVGNESGAVGEYSLLLDGGWNLCECSAWYESDKCHDVAKEIVSIRSSRFNTATIVRFETILKYTKRSKVSRNTSLILSTHK